MIILLCTQEAFDILIFMQKTEKKSEKQNNTRKFKAAYIFIYAPIGVLCPLIGQYLSSIGFSGTQIGTVTAVSTGVAIFASTFWGDKYTNCRDGRKVLFFLCIAAAAMALLNSFITVFAIFTITYGVMYFFQGPVMGLADAMVLESDENFASVRLCGAVGYALSVFAGGKIGGLLGLDKIFIVYAVTFVIGGLIVMTIRLQNAHPHEIEKTSDTEDKIKFSELFKEKKAIALIICGIFMFGTNVANNTYFSFLFRDGGGTVAGVGTAFLLMVGSEAPFMALAPKLAAKFSQQRLIAAAMILSAVRFGWYASGPSSQWLIALFFLQGMVNGVLLVEYMKYISSVVNPRVIGIAVSAFYAVSSNGGTILCNFFGGVAMDHFGSVGVYGLFSTLNVIGVVMYFAFGLHKQKKSKKDE